jgi:hypothetical protein
MSAPDQTLSVAQTRIQLYPLIDQFEAGDIEVVKVKSRSGDGAFLVSAKHYEDLTSAE